MKIMINCSLLLALSACQVAIMSKKKTSLTEAEVAPVLSSLDSQIFHNTHVVQGQSIVPLDWNNENTSSDSGMSYECKFDRFTDLSASSGSDCSLLPGTPNFDSLTGILNWQTNTVSWGPYEICVTGTNSTGSSSSCVVVDVTPNVGSGMLAYFDASFSNALGGQGSNSVFGSFNLLDGSSFSLSGFAQTLSSGFEGLVPALSAAENANPYRLTFDGVDDVLNMGTGYNSDSGFVFNAWVKPLVASGAQKVIASNADDNQNGFTLSQHASGSKQVQLVLGKKSYVDEVMSDSPVSYYRLNDAAGATVINTANSSVTATAYNTVTFQNGSSLRDSSANSAYFNANGGIKLDHVSEKNVFDAGSSFSVELWAFADSTPGSWRWLFSKAFTSHSAPYYQFDIRQGGDGSILVYMWQSTVYSQHLSVVSAPGAMGVGAWKHIVVTYDHAQTKLSLYINGALISADNNPTGTYANHATPISIGENYNAQSNSTYSFRGKISEVALYSTVLDLTRISAHYQSRLRPTCVSISSLSSGSWSSIGGSFKMGQNLDLYIDNVNECSLIYSANYSGSTESLTLGAEANGSRAWNGSIGEFRFYSETTGPTILTDDYLATELKFR